MWVSERVIERVWVSEREREIEEIRWKRERIMEWWRDGVFVIKRQRE